MKAALARLDRAAGDAERQARIGRVMEMVQRFVHDIGLLAAGQAVSIESYVDAQTARRIRNAVAPALEDDIVMRPDFGEYAQMRIEGNLLDRDVPVHVVVEVDDRSTRVDAQGHVVERFRRRLRFVLLLTPDLARVIDQRLEIA